MYIPNDNLNAIKWGGHSDWVTCNCGTSFSLSLYKDCPECYQEKILVNLQEAYLKIAKGFGKVVPIESLGLDASEIYNTLDGRNKFKIELLMMPSWATKNKVCKIGQDYYTHIRIKEDLNETIKN